MRWFRSRISPQGSTYPEVEPWEDEGIPQVPNPLRGHLPVGLAVDGAVRRWVGLEAVTVGGCGRLCLLPGFSHRSLFPGRHDSSRFPPPDPFMVPF